MHKTSLISLLLIVAGVVFLVLGARDYLGSIWGQFEASRQWHEPAPPQWREPAPQQSESAPAWLPPERGTAFAKLSIPRLGGDWFVFEGTGENDLRLGPGHMPGTALPGMPGNCVIAGHRDLHFRLLKDIRKGDEIVVDTFRGEYRYRVTGLSIVKPTDTAALQPTIGPVMNLVTCYPFYYIGPAPKRFVVQAVLETPQKAGQPRQPPAESQTAASGRRTS
jgi:sortase A